MFACLHLDVWLRGLCVTAAERRASGRSWPPPTANRGLHEIPWPLAGYVAETVWIRAIPRGPALAMQRRAMLRIHKEADGKGRIVLRLEGSLGSPWVPELASVLETMATEALVIDLASLAYADKQGGRVLRDLAARAELRGCSPFLAELLRGRQKP